MHHFLIKIFTDYQIIAPLIMVAISLKWGDWKNWQRYYPTMLFFASGDFIYMLLTYNHPLWEFESPLLKTTLSELWISLVGHPATVVLFLSNIPKGRLKQALWVLFWIFVFTIIEIVSHWLGFCSYHNGWSVWWSVLFNCLMFPLLWIHYKKPVWALPIAIMMGILIISYFRIPFSSMK